MKFLTLITLLLASFAAQAVPVESAAPVVQSVVTQDKVTNQVINQVGDKFLNLLYDKVEKYSALGENAVEKAVDVVKEQSPILVEEFLTWKFAYSLFNAVISWVVLFVGIIWVVYVVKKWNKKMSDWDEINFPTWQMANLIGPVVYFIFSFCPCPDVNGTGNFSPFDDTLECVKIKVAPRVYLIEQVIDFAKSKNK